MAFIKWLLPAAILLGFGCHSMMVDDSGRKEYYAKFPIGTDFILLPEADAAPLTFDIRFRHPGSIEDEDMREILSLVSRISGLDRHIIWMQAFRFGDVMGAEVSTSYQTVALQKECASGKWIVCCIYIEHASPE